MTDAQYENRFYKERKDFITLVFENGGIAICDNRYKESIVRCKCIWVVKSKKWKDVYDYCKENNLLK